MEENTYWLRLFQTIAAAICILALTVAGCTARNRTALERMVAGGADPMRAACAIGSDERSGVCPILAATK